MADPNFEDVVFCDGCAEAINADDALQCCGCGTAFCTDCCGLLDDMQACPDCSDECEDEEDEE